MNRDLFKAKIECALERARHRNIRLTTSWYPRTECKKYCISTSAHVLDFIIENTSMDFSATVSASKKLHVINDVHIITYFCGGMRGQKLTSLEGCFGYTNPDRKFAFDLGCEVKKKL